MKISNVFREEKKSDDIWHAYKTERIYHKLSMVKDKKGKSMNFFQF